MREFANVFSWKKIITPSWDKIAVLCMTARLLYEFDFPRHAMRLDFNFIKCIFLNFWTH